MPAKVGGDETAPTPGVLGRGALASCLTIGIAVWAARLGVPIDALEVEVQADFDARGELGMGGVAPGYSEVRYVVAIDSPAPEQRAGRAGRAGRAPQPLPRRVRQGDAAAPHPARQRRGGLSHGAPTAASRPALRLGSRRHGVRAGLARPARAGARPDARHGGAAPGERVLDVACGTGLVSLRIAAAVGAAGAVVGTDISGQMVEAARRIAAERGARQRALRARRRRGAAVCRCDLRCRRLRPRPDVRARTRSRRSPRCAACSSPAAGPPRRCGVPGATAAGPRSSRSPMRASPPRSARCSSISARRTCSRAALRRRASSTSGWSACRRRCATPRAEDALAAVFRGGPVALAYSRFDDATRRAVHAEYLEFHRRLPRWRWLPRAGRVRGRGRPGSLPPVTE